MAEASNLWEDKPHPVGFLVPVANLFKRLAVTLFLRRDEALQIELVVAAFVALSFWRILGFLFAVGTDGEQFFQAFTHLLDVILFLVVCFRVDNDIKTVRHQFHVNVATHHDGVAVDVYRARLRALDMELLGLGKLHVVVVQ